MASELWVLVPITALVAGAAIILGIAYFLTERSKAVNAAGGDYRRLAEEAVRGQEALIKQVDAMNRTLKEIERLLREV